MSGSEFDIWSTLLAIGIFQGVFIIPFLIKKLQKPGIWLALLIGIICLNLLEYLLINTGYYTLAPHFLMIPLPFIFLIGPFYYFYVCSLIKKPWKFQFSDMIHFVPFTGAFIYRLDFYLSTSNEKVSIIANYLSTTELSGNLPLNIFVGLHTIQTVIYLIFSAKMIRKFTSEWKVQEKATFLRWLKGFAYAFSVYWLLNFLWTIYLTIADAFFHEVDYIVMLIVSIMISTISYVALYRNKEFEKYLLSATEQKYKKSSLTPEQSASILKRLVKVVEEEKVYLNPDLRIADLASRLNLSTNILSQVLNQELNKNFFEFINEYRIAEAIKRLADPKFSHYSIFGIALEVGFSNKNTFNRLFKKQTGQTPSQFIRSHSIQ